MAKGYQKKITARMILSHSSGLPILRGFYTREADSDRRAADSVIMSNQWNNLLDLIVGRNIPDKSWKLWLMSLFFCAARSEIEA